MRLRLLETIGVAAAITAGFCVTYGFLEGVGYPRLSMFTVWTVLGGSVALVHIGRRLLNK
jgi:hypothetical protein